jgi:hypothetical protein
VNIYLDVSCLNRPFDDQSQPRIRLEAEAIAVILEACDVGDWKQLSSEMARLEIDATPDATRRARVRLLLPDADATLNLTAAVLARAGKLKNSASNPPTPSMWRPPKPSR